MLKRNVPRQSLSLSIKVLRPIKKKKIKNKKIIVYFMNPNKDDFFQKHPMPSEEHIQLIIIITTCF